MKRFLVGVLCAGCFVMASAQDAREEILQNVSLSGSNYVAYRGPQKSLTKAPKGYEPYYLSHYGRHGSRYLIGDTDYDWPIQTLQRADSLGKLTALGQDVLRRHWVLSSTVRLRAACMSASPRCSVVMSASTRRAPLSSAAFSRWRTNSRSL